MNVRIKCLTCLAPCKSGLRSVADPKSDSRRLRIDKWNGGLQPAERLEQPKGDSRDDDRGTFRFKRPRAVPVAKLSRTGRSTVAELARTWQCKVVKTRGLGLATTVALAVSANVHEGGRGDRIFSVIDRAAAKFHWRPCAASIMFGIMPTGRARAWRGQCKSLITLSRTTNK